MPFACSGRNSPSRSCTPRCWWMTLPCDQPNSILMFPDATEKNEKAIIIFLQPQILPSVKGVGSLAEELCARLCSRFSNYMSHLQKCQPFRGKSKMELLGFFFPSVSLSLVSVTGWASHASCTQKLYERRMSHSWSILFGCFPSLQNSRWTLALVGKASARA